MVSIIVFLIVLISGLADSLKNLRITTSVAKGRSEYIDQVKQVGYYGIKYEDCFAEIDDQEIFCPDHNVLTAVRIQVEDNSGQVNVIIPETVVGTVYAAGAATNNGWRITIARHGEACRPGSQEVPQLPQLPALVTLYAACVPLEHNKVKQLPQNDKPNELNVNYENLPSVSDFLE